MCHRCLANDPAPTAFMQSVFAKMDRELPANATGADVVDATHRFFADAGSPPGGQGHVAQEAVKMIIRTAKRSGVGLNSAECSPENARHVLRAVARGQLRAQA